MTNIVKVKEYLFIFFTSPFTLCIFFLSNLSKDQDVLDSCVFDVFIVHFCLNIFFSPHFFTCTLTNKGSEKMLAGSYGTFWL